MPDNPNDCFDWLETVTAQHMEDCRARLTAIQNAEGTLAELFAKENAAKSKLRAWDFALAYWGDRFTEFIREYGCDFKNDGTTMRGEWDKFIKEVSHRKELIILELRKILDEERKLCRGIGIKYK